MIIDAHAHIFPRVHGRVAAGATRGLGMGRIAVGDTEKQLIPPYGDSTAYTPKMILANMDWAGVDGAILLQGTFYGECNQYALEAQAEHPQRLGCACYFDPWAPNPRQTFADLALMPFGALKIEFSERTGLSGLYPDARLDDAELAWLWEGIEALGRVLVLDLGRPGDRSYQVQAVEAIARHHSGLKIVVAHLGQPQPTAEASSLLWRLWLELIDLGRLPNVYFDTAALPALLPDEDFPYPAAKRYFKLAVERIGPAKLMWGTDQPGLLAQMNYPQLLRLAQLHAEFLSERERDMFLGVNAKQVYGFAAT
jgi:L-galactono-1,5-lactonase